MKGKLKVWLVVTLCLALVAFSLPILTATFNAEAEGPVVILLDPGHGGPDFGAINKAAGLYESEINLAIAKACKEELERYANVQVFMTHTGLSHEREKLSLSSRVNMAYSVGADILISLHTNASTSNSANGSEIYVSKSTYKSEYNQKSTDLAICFLRRFKDMGMNIRGVKTRLSNGSRQYVHSDGTREVGDYYAVIGDTIRKYAIPGILVEHGFIVGDANHLNTPEKLKAFGIADATAIAEYYGLRLRSESDTEEEVSSSDEPVEPPVIVTDSQREEAVSVSEMILALPAEVDFSAEEKIVAARAAYEGLTYDEKRVIESDVTEQLYHTVIQLEYLRNPVRLSADDNEDIFINRINSTLTGIDALSFDSKGTTADTLISLLSVHFDEQSISENAVKQARQRLTDAILGGMEFENTESISLDEDEVAALAAEIENEIRNSTYKIVLTDRDSKPVKGSGFAATGYAVQLLCNDEVIDSATIIIFGDLSGDGIIDSLDELMIDRHLQGVESLDGVALQAADMNNDGYINLLDEDILSRKIVAGK